MSKKIGEEKIIKAVHMTQEEHDKCKEHTTYPVVFIVPPSGAFSKVTFRTYGRTSKDKEKFIIAEWYLPTGEEKKRRMDLMKKYAKAMNTVVVKGANDEKDKKQNVFENKTSCDNKNN